MVARAHPDEALRGDAGKPRGGPGPSVEQRAHLGTRAPDEGREELGRRRYRSTRQPGGQVEYVDVAGGDALAGFSDRSAVLSAREVPLGFGQQCRAGLDVRAGLERVRGQRLDGFEAHRRASAVVGSEHGSESGCLAAKRRLQMRAGFGEGQPGVLLGRPARNESLPAEPPAHR